MHVEEGAAASIDASQCITSFVIYFLKYNFKSLHKLHTDASPWFNVYVNIMMMMTNNNDNTTTTTIIIMKVLF